MEEMRKFVEEVLLDVAKRCHAKELDADTDEEINTICALYEFVKEQLINMEEDISLYRYKKLNEYAQKEVEEQSIFMNIPSNFDDLFDSNFVVDIEVPDSDFACHFNAIYFSKYVDEKKHMQFLKGGTNGWDRYFEQLNNEVDKRIRVSSLSEEYTNIPLWYYYANQHEGICIEYSLKEIVKNLRENEYIMPVIYTDNYFKFNPARVRTSGERKMSIQSNVLVKHESWKFEKEWRIVQICDECNNEHTQNIPIKSVTFGLNVGEKDKRKLMDLNKAIDYYELKRTCYIFFTLLSP